MPLWSFAKSKKDKTPQAKPVPFSSITDYAANEQRSFKVFPFCESDALVFSQLVYIHFDGLVSEPSVFSKAFKLSDIYKQAAAATNTGSSQDGKRIALLNIAAQNPRFSSVRLAHFSSILDVSLETQFCAVTFFLPDSTAFVAFRGTDNTLTGWKENFNMAFQSPVPSQTEAVKYLNKIAGFTLRKLRVGGHSKGGNLAAYAAISCKSEVQARLLDIYSFDGPGFRDMLFMSEGYRRIRQRTHCYVPQGSIIGTLLYQNNDMIIIESAATGFAQHSVFSWKLQVSELRRADGLTAEARRFDATINNWMASLNDSERKATVDILFELIDRSNASSFNEVISSLKDGGLSLRKMFVDLQPQQRREMADILKALAVAYYRSGKEMSDN